MSNAKPTSTSPEIIQALHEQIRLFETGRRTSWREVFSSGFSALDNLLPEKGFSPGTLVEWVAAAQGGGASTLALIAARQACGDGKPLLVVDRHETFYPPAAAGLGFDLQQLIIVRPGSWGDEAWTVDQALRCAGVGAVLSWPEKLDDHTFRRWQLAAEEGGTLGLLVRSETARSQPSWAELRFLVTPLGTRARSGGAPGTPPIRASGRRLRIEVLRCRGAGAVETVELEIDTNQIETPPGDRHEPNPLPLDAAMAFAAPRASSART